MYNISLEDGYCFAMYLDLQFMIIVFAGLELQEIPPVTAKKE
jgi:hypothetical protein